MTSGIMFEVWLVVASPAATMISAFVAVALLIIRGAHREPFGALNNAKIAVTFIESAIAYVLMICAIGQLVFDIPVSYTISKGFGDQRVAWLFLGVLADMLFRMWRNWNLRRSREVKQSKEEAGHQ